MKKHQPSTHRWHAITVCALASLTTPAWSQSSVSVRGIVDGGVYVANSGGTVGRTEKFGSGIMSGPRLIFSGNETLGGGLHAGFMLELGFSTADGSLSSYTGTYANMTPTAPLGTASTGFNRQSYLWIRGGYGELRLGRVYTPVFYAAIVGDPMDLGLFGNLSQSSVMSGTGGEAFGSASNSAIYTSPTFGGLKARLLYSFGAQSAGGAGAPPKGSYEMKAVSLNYKNGGFEAAGAYQDVTRPLSASGAWIGTGQRKDAVVSLRYRAQDWSVVSGFTDLRQPTANTNGRQYWLGGTVQVGIGTVYLLAQQLTQQSAAGDKRSKVYALSYSYPLSKRTTLYASSGVVDNNSIATMPLVGGPVVSAGAPGATVSALGMGLRHTF